MGNREHNYSSISYDAIRALSVDRSAHVHFVGIGGVSMYSLAVLTLSYGATVSGSDRVESDRTRDLMLRGVQVFIAHTEGNVGDADLVVYSHAISQDNPELCEARRLNIPLVSRAQYLGAIMLGYSSRIGVSGSHGKSTTVAMLDSIFSYIPTPPTVLSGADLTIGSPLRIGSHDVLIYEACEYKDSFLRFSPTISVALNLELDHTDYFEDIDALKCSFCNALERAGRFALVNGDDENLSSIIKKIKSPVISFGSREGNDYRYSVTSFRQVGFEFEISRFGSVIGNFEINVPGVFNVANATAAIIVALEYGIDRDIIFEALRAYRGIPGRLEYIGSRYGRRVFYDYAHHPTEILASVNALKQQVNEPLTVVFMPHTFSRTKALWNEFCGALSQADHLIITDIYPAREKPISGVTSQRLADTIGNSAIYCPEESIIEKIDSSTSGSIVLMGAGDFESIKKEILKT